MTDLSKWKLEVKEGRQVWQYVEEDSKKVQTMVDRYLLGLDTVLFAHLRPLPAPLSH